jgi:hypothetical protein
MNSFPRVQSHYAHSETEKECLQPNLTLTKMYIMYKAAYPEANVKTAVWRCVLEIST